MSRRKDYDNLEGGVALRLRHKLEGYDDTWHDLPATMRVMVHFRDRNGDVVGGNGFYLEGQTPGWRGTAENSDFVSRREHATDPHEDRIVFMPSARLGARMSC